LLNDNKAIRILILGLEALDEYDFSMAAQSEQILKEGNIKLSERNPHLKGTTILIEYTLKDILSYTFDTDKHGKEKEEIDQCVLKKIINFPQRGLFPNGISFPAGLLRSETR